MSFFSTPASATASTTSLVMISCSSTCSGSSALVWWRPTGIALVPMMATRRVIGWVPLVEMVGQYIYNGLTIQLLEQTRDEPEPRVRRHAERLRCAGLPQRARQLP